MTVTGSAVVTVASTMNGELQTDLLKIPVTVTSKVGCQIYDYGLVGTVTQASSIGLSRSIISSEEGLKIFVEGKNNGQPISSSPVPLSATPMLSSAGNPPMYSQTWAPCGASGCPTGYYERTYHLRDSAGVTKCIVGPAILLVQ